MYQFPDFPYNFEQGIDHLDYNPITREALRHQDTYTAAVEDILATQSSPPIVPSPRRSAHRTEETSRSIHNNFYDPQGQGVTLSQSSMACRPTTGELLFQKLSNMESQINKISQTPKEVEHGKDTGPDEGYKGGNDVYTDDKVNKLLERVNNLEARLSAIDDALDELILLPRRVDSYSKWLHDLARTFNEENERINTISSGVDDACRRFHHLLARLSRHRDSDDLMGFYDSEGEGMGVAISS